MPRVLSCLLVCACAATGVGAQTIPAAAVPPPVYLVFFDWNSAVVGPSGKEVIKVAADAFRAGAPVTVQVTGFTDTSGSPDYNQRLSVRRANAVAAVMVQDGVPQNALVVTGRGQNDLRVPTPDGVREPQNRRVEIVEGGGPPPTSMR